MTNIYKKAQSIPRTARNNRIYPGEYTGGNAPVLSGTGINLDWVSVTPEKVTINRDTHIEGNLTASEEVVAWVAGAVTSDVLAGLTAAAPLRKSSASNIVLDYNTSQFEVSGGILQIKAGVLSPSAHSHLISDVTGLQAALDSKMVVHTHPYRADSWVPSWSDVTGKPATFEPAAHSHSYLPLAGGTMSNTNLVTNLNAQYVNGILGYDFNAYTKALKAPGFDLRFFSGDGNHGLLIPYAGGLIYDGHTVYHSGNLTNTLTSNYIPKWNGLGFSNSIIFESLSAGIGINSTIDTAGYVFNVKQGANKNFSIASQGGELSFEFLNDAINQNIPVRLYASPLKLFAGSKNAERNVFLITTTEVAAAQLMVDLRSNNDYAIQAVEQGVSARNILLNWFGGSVLVGYAADPTSGNKLAVNGAAYVNGNITAQIATLTGCNAQSFIIKDSGNNTRWTVSYNTSTYALEFKNASGVLECSIDQSGNLKAKGEITAYATI